MINFDFESECYGCSACSINCPVNAISMLNGLTPYVDNIKCIGCNKCIAVCPKYQEGSVVKELVPLDSFVCRNRNEQVVLSSSSGGVFFEAAKEALKRGWYVSGCIYDEHQMPKHIVTRSIDDVYLMQGSKYVQSRIDDALKCIQNLIQNNNTVLFSGVPCQIAAIKNLIGDNNKLFTVAVTCHGSIEPKYWQYYLDSERSINGEIESVTMREKTKGYLNYGLRVNFKNGKTRVTYRYENGYFLKAFTSGLFERERCLQCNYKGSRIYADLLLSDAWGMEKYYPNICTEKGASTVICLSHVGMDFFNSIAEKFYIENIDVKTIIENNQRIITPAPNNPKRISFLKEINSNPDRIQSICKKYVKKNLASKIITFLHRGIR